MCVRVCVNVCMRCECACAHARVHARARVHVRTGHVVLRDMSVSVLLSFSRRLPAADCLPRGSSSVLYFVAMCFPCGVCECGYFSHYSAPCRSSSEGMERCVAVCCMVLQCNAVYFSVLQCVAVYCRALQCVAVCCTCLLGARRRQVVFRGDGAHEAPSVTIAEHPLLTQPELALFNIGKRLAKHFVLGAKVIFVFDDV